MPNKKKKGFAQAILQIFGINKKMQNRAGGGGTTAGGKRKTLDEIRREAMGR